MERLPTHEQPELVVVVDAEEEFGWSQPFSRDSTATSSIPAQERAHAIYDRLGIVPTYVIDYPVAADPVAVDFFTRLVREGRAEIGAHLHAWVTPPHLEEVNTRNSYQCNLPVDLERAKMTALTETISTNFGLRPKIFRAGRYGFGERTKEILLDLGYEIDCSFVPYTSFAADHGPAYYGVSDQPTWLDVERRLLEVPLTSGYLGRFSRLGPRFQRMFDHPVAEQMYLRALLGRMGLLERSRLTPEGISAREQCKLLRTMVEQGKRTFVLSYHSPSLAPGHTPYVNHDEELKAFLARIEAVLCFFRDQLDGRFTTLSRIYARECARLEPVPSNGH